MPDEYRGNWEMHSSSGGVPPRDLLPEVLISLVVGVGAEKDEVFALFYFYFYLFPLISQSVCLSVCLSVSVLYTH